MCIRDRTIIVKIIEPIKTPLSPNNLKHKIVVKAAANIFTKLFPIKIIPSNLSGLCSNLFALIADLSFCLIKCFNLNRLSAIIPVSELEKKAERKSKIKMLATSIQIGSSFKFQ